ncbi:MAG: hypothetical protein ABFC84_02115 [Veillonellales bacterium]
MPGLAAEERFDLKLTIAVELAGIAGRDVDIVDMEAVSFRGKI